MQQAVEQQSGSGQPSGPVAEQGAAPDRGSQAPQRGRRTLWLVLAVCLAPVVISYLAYYVAPPMGRTNYGALLNPQRDVPADLARVLPGAPALSIAEPSPPTADRPAATRRVGQMGDLHGRWVMFTQGAQGCPESCVRRLYFMRQTHASMGRERERVLQVMILTDDQPLDPRLPALYPDLIVLQSRRAVLDPFMALQADEASTVTEQTIGLIDPLQHFMMRFPPDPDPDSVRKDLQRLLKASRIG